MYWAPEPTLTTCRSIKLPHSQYAADNTVAENLIQCVLRVSPSRPESAQSRRQYYRAATIPYRL
jgi:hypothetical protein